MSRVLSAQVCVQNDDFELVWLNFWSLAMLKKKKKAKTVHVEATAGSSKAPATAAASDSALQPPPVATGVASA